jgi:hypothetical protein
MRVIRSGGDRCKSGSWELFEDSAPHGPGLENYLSR